MSAPRLRECLYPHRPTLSHTHYACKACCAPTHTRTQHVRCSHTHDMCMPHAHPRAAHTHIRITCASQITTTGYLACMWCCS